MPSNHSYDVAKSAALESLVEEYLQAIIKKLPEGMVAYRDDKGKLSSTNTNSNGRLFPELNDEILQRVTTAKKYETVRALIDQFLVVAAMYKEIHGNKKNLSEIVDKCQKLATEGRETFTKNTRKNSQPAKFHAELMAVFSMGDLDVVSKQELIAKKTHSLLWQSGRMHTQQIRMKAHHNTMKRRFGNFS